MTFSQRLNVCNLYKAGIQCTKLKASYFMQTLFAKYILTYINIFKILCQYNIAKNINKNNKIKLKNKLKICL